MEGHLKIPSVNIALPEVSCCCHLPHQDGEACEHWAVMRSSALQVELTVQVTTEQVELGGLQVLGGFHGAPNPLWNLQQQLYLGCHGIEFLLGLFLALVRK